MDPVDVLSFSVMAAQIIRSSRRAEEVLAEAFRSIGQPAPDPAEPIAVRIARLAHLAGDGRRELMQFLQERAGPLPMNRPMADPNAELAEPDPEAVRLAEYAEAAEDEGASMFDERHFGAFRVAERSAVGFFYGPKSEQPVELPATVRCVMDYPLEVPVLFTIETGVTPWDLWDICCAIATEYARIYEQPERHGVWGHDITDLWIENLIYFPKERLIYPHIGS